MSVSARIHGLLHCYHQLANSESQAVTAQRTSHSLACSNVVIIGQHGCSTNSPNCSVNRLQEMLPQFGLREVQ